MASGLDLIVGKTFLGMDAIHDYFQVRFSDDFGMNIYNRMEIRSNGRGVEGLLGKEVSSVVESGEGIEIFLGSDASIFIGIMGGDYRGPEAFALYLPDGDQMIWRWGDE